VAAVGTAYGGWRIIRTLGLRVTALDPVQGFAAEVSGASVIQAASEFGIPISTTHAITSSILARLYRARST
jgi:PiT family inorganic phosphate transporter